MLKPSWLWDGREAKSWRTAAGQTSTVVTVDAATMTHRLATTCQIAGAWKLNWFAALHSRPLLQFVFTPHAKCSVFRLIVWHAQLEHSTLKECIISVVIFHGNGRTADIFVYAVSRVESDEASCLCERHVLLNQPVHGIGVLSKQTELTHAVCSENITEIHFSLKQHILCWCSSVQFVDLWELSFSMSCDTGCFYHLCILYYILHCN